MESLIVAGVEKYAAAHTTADGAMMAALSEETRVSTTDPQMMVGELEGRFLSMLVAISQARLILEIGTFTGYSALSMAAALPPDGRIITCEIDPRHAAIAKRYIGASPWSDRIEVRLGPALDTIATLDGPFDLVFIDADKSGYRSYYEAVLPKLSEHGLIAIDNVLWSGAVVDPSDDASEDTKALIELNDFIVSDSRVECVMLTVRDGVTLVRPVPERA